MHHSKIKIIVHERPHWDEIVGVWLAQTYGGGKYVGLDKAAIRFVEEDPLGGDNRFDSEGLYPIGTGKGRCDDKGPDGKRKAGKCSALLVAEDLGVEKNQELILLLEETLHCDTQKGVRLTQLAEALKLIMLKFGTAGQEFFLQHSLTVVGAIVAQCANRYTAGRGEKGALDFFEGFVRNGRFTDQRIIGFMRKQLQIGAAHTESVTEIDFVLRAMQRNGTSLKDTTEFARFILQHVYQVQEHIRDLSQVIKPDNKTHRGQNSREFVTTGLFDDCERPVRFIIVDSDDPFAHRATSYLRYDVHVIRQSTGNVQVFANTSKGVKLHVVAAMIRWLELPSDQKTGFLDELEDAGIIEGVSHWYYFVEAQMLFNGSQTHTGVRPTELAGQAIVDVLRHAFHPREIGKWKALHGKGRFSRQVRCPERSVKSNVSVQSAGKDWPTDIAADLERICSGLNGE